MGSFARAAHPSLTIEPTEAALPTDLAAPIVALDCWTPEVRPILPRIAALSQADHAQFEKLLLALDETSRFARFSGMPSDRFLIEHARVALSTVAWIAGAFVNDELRGVVELYGQADQQNVEAAFIVAEGWRRRGLGTALLRAAIAWSRRAGRDQLRMIFSTRNVPMRRLAQKTDARLDLVLGEFVADVAVGNAQTVADPSCRVIPSATEIDVP